MRRLIIILLIVVSGTVSGLTYEGSLMCETCHIDNLGQNLKTSALSPGSCSSCHTSVSHRININESSTCNDCHDHWSIEGRYINEQYKRQWIDSRVNPHTNDYMCGTCHQTDDSGSQYNMKIADDMALCGQCHSKDQVNMGAHTAGFTYKSTDKTQIPKQFPLKDGIVTCMTCHDFHCEKEIGHAKEKNMYLRGEAASREDFCMTCHKPEAYQRYNPHIQLDRNNQLIENNCVTCHTRTPDLTKDVERGTPALKGSTNGVCKGCHMLRETHPTGINHLRKIPERLQDYVDQKIAEKGVPFPLGKDYEILCITCHSPHQFELIPGYVKEKLRNRTRYLSGRELCIMCHIK